MSEWEIDEGETVVLERPSTTLPPSPKRVGPDEPSEIEDRRIIPSFLDRLEHAVAMNIDLRSVAAAALIPVRDVVAFATANHIEQGSAMELLGGSADYTLLVGGGWLERIWLSVQGFAKGDEELVSTGYPLPIAELHAPHSPGCAARFSSEHASSSRAAVSIFVRGAGAGGGLAARVKIRQDIAIEAGCIQATVPADVSVTPWTNHATGEVIYDVRVTNVDESWSPHEIPSWRSHPCGGEYERVLRHMRSQEAQGWLRRGDDYFEHQVGIDGTRVDRSWNVHRERYFNLDIGGVIAVRSQFSEEYEYQYSLRPPVDCVGYFEDGQSEVLWWAWKDRGKALASPASLESV